MYTFSNKCENSHLVSTYVSASFYTVKLKQLLHNVLLFSPYIDTLNSIYSFDTSHHFLAPPRLLTHLFVVEAVVCVVRVLVQYEVGKPPHSLLSHPLSGVQILLFRNALLNHRLQSQSPSLH